MRTRMLMSVFALAAAATPAAAQSEWLAAEGTSIALEYRHAALSDETLDEDINRSMLNGAFFLSGRAQIPVVGLAGVAEIPFAYGKFGEDEAEISGTRIGNIYLGVEKSLFLGAATITGGLRVPTSPDFEDEDPEDAANDAAAFLAGLASSATDRTDAFTPKTTVPQIGIRFGIPGVPVFDVEANVNANYVMFGDDEEDEVEGEDDNEFVLDGGVRAFAGVMGLRAGVGLEGAMNLSQDDEEEGDSSMYHAGLWADYEFGMIRPGVSFFIPLSSDYSDTVDWMLGLSLEVDLPM